MQLFLMSALIRLNRVKKGIRHHFEINVPSGRLGIGISVGGVDPQILVDVSCVTVSVNIT